MNKKTVILLLVALAVGAWYYFYHRQTGEGRAEEKKQQANAAIEAAVASMVQKHNAVVDWHHALGGNSPDGPIYTLELEKALMPNDGRPVLVYASVADVRKNGESLQIVLESEIEFAAELKWIIEATAFQADMVTKRRTDPLNKYAVLVAVSSVEKLGAKYGASGAGENAYIEKFHDMFLVKGNCVDLVFAGEYGMMKSFEIRIRK